VLACALTALPTSNPTGIALGSRPTRAMDVMGHNGGKGDESMATFTIDGGNNITGRAPARRSRTATSNDSRPKAQPEQAARVEIWNHVSGLKPVRKFTSRGAYLETAPSLVRSMSVRRWQRSRPSRGKGPPASPEPTQREAVKKPSVIKPLRAKGTTFAEIMSETGWPAH